MFRAISKTEKEKKSMDVLIVEPDHYYFGSYSVDVHGCLELWYNFYI